MDTCLLLRRNLESFLAVIDDIPFLRNFSILNHQNLKTGTVIIHFQENVAGTSLNRYLECYCTKECCTAAVAVSGMRLDRGLTNLL